MAVSFLCKSQVYLNFDSDSISTENKIYTPKEVDTKPEFPGGDDAIFRTVTPSMRYPVDARRNGISGTVIIGVVVEKDGSVTHHAILQRAWPSLDQEALRVSLLIPNGWIPATLNGHPVRCRYQLPLRFVLQ